jgi:hypothetical protein
VKADIRDIQSAISLIKEALSLDSSNVDGWQLLALLSSSNKASRKAIMACNAGIQECGESWR